MSGQRACLWTVLRCREREFQKFLGVGDEEAAARRVKEVCEIGSRSQLDSDAEALARWNERIRHAYQQHLQNNNHPTTQEM